MKTLYHGTNADFDKISLQEGSQYKDFGQGFYLTDDTGYSVTEAMDRIYSSRLLKLLQQEDDELYVQSPSYLYQLFLKEK